MTRKDIEAKISKMGDYVKIDYLSSCLKNHIDFDTRKYVFQKLSELYISKGMFADAGKMILSSAEINTTIPNKIQDYLKATEFFIKGSDNESTLISMGRALAIASESQKTEIKNKIKSTYLTYADFLVQKNKRRQAITAYENLLDLGLNENEKKDIESKLLKYYQDLGLMKEYYLLKRKTNK